MAFAASNLEVGLGITIPAGYLGFWGAQGKYVVLKCPSFPALPKIAGARSISEAVWNLRTYYDRWFLLTFDPRWGMTILKCSTVPAQSPFASRWENRIIPVAAMNARLGKSVSFFKQFRYAVWNMIFPGQVDFRSDVLNDLNIHSGSGPGAKFGAAWTTAAATGQGWTVPLPRKSHAVVATRIELRAKTLNKVLAEFERDYQGIKKMWPGYLAALNAWSADFSLSEQEVYTRMRNIAYLLRAFRMAPWPHHFFSSFMNAPIVTLPGFFKGIPYRDPALAASGYFPRSVDAINKNIAQFIEANLDAFNTHFETKVRQWIKKMQDEMKKAEKEAKRIKIIVAIIAIIVTIISAGILTIVITTIAQSVSDIYTARKLTKAQVGAVEKMMAVLGISRSRIDAFREWLTANADVPAQAPPTPEEVEVTGTYSVFVGDKLVSNSNDVNQALAEALVQSEIGDRLTVKNEKTGQAEAVFLREEKGLRLMPKNIAGKVQALTPAQAKEVAGEKPFPWIAVLPVAAVILG